MRTGDKMRSWRFVLCVGSAMLCGVGSAPAQAADRELTLWTMGEDQIAWVNWLHTISANFEKKNPDAKVKITFYDKNALGVALKTALRGGQGPDMFYTEPDQKEYADNGYLHPLDDVVDWNNVEPWARGAWSSNGHVWGVPSEAYTNEIYYNADLMKELGVTIPADGKISQDAFLALLEKAKAAGMEPIVTGVGDRPFTGAYLTFELLLRKLGPDDYRKLLEGNISYTDPRVVEIFNYVKKIVETGAFPKSIATMSLTDSYAYFFNKRGLLFPQGTWYTQRAFSPADKGGQPDNFHVGIMTYPTVNGGACNNCKTLAIGGGYSISADTKNQDLATAFFREMATPEMGTLWTVSNYGESGIKSDVSNVTGKYADYFKRLAELRKDSRFFIGIPLNFIDGQCRETFVQVVNVAFPSGLISVDDALKQMNAACYKG